MNIDAWKSLHEGKRDRWSSPLPCRVDLLQEALRIAALDALPGPDAQDYIDRNRIIQEWLEAAEDRLS